VDSTNEERAAKARRIRLERSKLRRLLRDIDPDRLKAVDKLVGNLAFMSVTLEDLQDEINLNGVTSKYQNGENQWGEKKSPEAEYYAQLLQRYLPAMKQLIDLLPEGDPKKKQGDPLMDWVNGERP
jgi:hypothetical protein